MVVVGPSGSGKTTVLRIAAGLEQATSGEVWIGDELVNDVPPMDRNIAMVFQSYALYPHMTVYENMAFGLKLHGLKKREIEPRVNSAAQMLGIDELLKRKPAQLSGGQRQRVAMGRAIVREPDAFLMDEPLSNLDAKLRVEMRAYLATLHQRLADDDALRHARPDRGDDDGRPGRGHARGAPPAGGPPAAALRPPRQPLRRRLHRLAGDEPRALATRASATARSTPTSGRRACGSPTACWRRGPSLRGYVGKPVIAGLRPEDIEDAAFAPSANGSSLDVDVALAEAMGAELIAHFPIAAADRSARRCGAVHGAPADGPEDASGLDPARGRRQRRGGDHRPAQPAQRAHRPASRCASPSTPSGSTSSTRRPKRRSGRSRALGDREGDRHARLDELRPGLDRRGRSRCAPCVASTRRPAVGPPALDDVGDPADVQAGRLRDRLRLALRVRDRDAERRAGRARSGRRGSRFGPLTWFAPASTAASITAPALSRFRIVTDTEFDAW